jgi:hypothetical protein
MERTQQHPHLPAVSDTTACVLCIVVPYTTPALTQAALQYASVCSELAVHVCLVDVQVVPFPRPLDDRPLTENIPDGDCARFSTKVECRVKRRSCTRETAGSLQPDAHARIAGCRRRAPAVVADPRETAGSRANQGRPSGRAGSCWEVSHARPFLCRYRNRVFRFAVQLHNSGRTPVRRQRWNTQSPERWRSAFFAICCMRCFIRNSFEDGNAQVR